MKTSPDTENQITIGIIFKSIISAARYLRSRLKIIILFCLIGATLGFLYSVAIPQKFRNKVTFVVEESRGSSSGLSAIAGQFGLDLGGGGGGDFFSSDNILIFFRSESLCREVLMKVKNTAFQDENLADTYARVLGYKKKWNKEVDLGNVNFSKYSTTNLPRAYDSLLQILIKKHLLKNDLVVYKTDKNASFITLDVRMKDELLAKLFTDQLLEVAIKKYVDSKIQLKSKNVLMLQKRADSLYSLLETKTISSAVSQQSLVDVNPAFKIGTVNPEINNREKAMIATIYAEVIKNLEISKTLLNQHTPSVQIIDKSTFPLEKIKLNKWLGLFIGSGIGFLVISIGLLFFKWLKGAI